MFAVNLQRVRSWSVHVSLIPFRGFHFRDVFGCAFTRQATMFLNRGVQGEMNPDRLKTEMAPLKLWLIEHKADWQQAGEPRRLGYHGPMTPVKQRLWEVQIPIKKVAVTKSK